MPNWSNQIPEQAIKHGFDLRRTPTDGPLRAIITSTDMIGAYTHWWGGRTMPCESPNCAACDENQPARWHVYVTCMDPKTRETFIFETTAQAAKALEIYRSSFETLRGCLITASRPKRRRNAKIEILTQPADLSKTMLPQPPDIQKALSVIWQIPSTAIETPTAQRQTKTVTLNKKIMDKTRDPADNSNGHARKLKPSDLLT